jgi:hypothetical protein
MTGLPEDFRVASRALDRGWGASIGLRAAVPGFRTRWAAALGADPARRAGQHTIDCLARDRLAGCCSR